MSYELQVHPDAPVVLVCTFRGSEGQRRAFDVLVEGTAIGSDTLEIIRPSSSTANIKCPRR